MKARDYHEECGLIIAAFITYLTATESRAEFWDYVVVYTCAAGLVLYWAARTVIRIRARKGVRS